ncbi:MAG: SGNH/GDSL hydrolase family protein, partial [Planctomycetes bacterium]|nr:SGNH/GDSL hydrolase family protein [Planctomycetota bacterium]
MKNISFNLVFIISLCLINTSFTEAQVTYDQDDFGALVREDSLTIELSNSGFETGDLFGWLVWPPDGTTLETVSDAYSFSGEYGLKLSGPSVSVYQTVIPSDGVEYTLSGQFVIPIHDLISAGQSAFIEIELYDGDWNEIASFESDHISSTTMPQEWHRLSVSGLCPINVVYMTVAFKWTGLENGDPTGSVFCDDLVLSYTSGSDPGCGVVPLLVEERQNSDYMSVDFDDSQWDTIDLPGGSNELTGNNSYWFRKEIEVPQNWSSYTLFALVLGSIDGADATWFNGVQIGVTEFIEGNRTYQVPDSLVQIGQNLITIQLGLLENSGGFTGDPEDMQFLSAWHPNEYIPLSGEWRYSQGISLEVEEGIRDRYKLAVMGSSVAYGSGADSNHGYAYNLDQLLQQRYQNGQGLNWEMVNISIGGNNTIDVLNRFDRNLIPTCAKYVVFGLSLGNEGIHENGQPAFDQFRDNMLVLIQRARNHNIEPLVVNCYARGDFNETDYQYTREMNLLINSWDVPSINVLGAIDDGSGQWVDGYWADPWHPNTAGHLEMFYAIVPSLFDALDLGKPLPQKVDGSFVTIENPDSPAPVQFTPDAVMHPFALSFKVRTTSAGAVAGIETETGSAVIVIDPDSGNFNYVSSSGEEINGTATATDSVWHNITLSHYHARMLTLLYVDGLETGSLEEQLVPT